MRNLIAFSRAPFYQYICWPPVFDTTRMRHSFPLNATQSLTNTLFANRSCHSPNVSKTLDICEKVAFGRFQHRQGCRAQKCFQKDRWLDYLRSSASRPPPGIIGVFHQYRSLLKLIAERDRSKKEAPDRLNQGRGRMLGGRIPRSERNWCRRSPSRQAARPPADLPGAAGRRCSRSARPTR
jgi:hypothetical protein